MLKTIINRTDFMKLKSLLLTLSCGMLMCTACSDDENVPSSHPENNGKDVPQLVLDEFSQRYADVKDVYWSRVQNYHVARFNAPISRAASQNYSSSAWFTADGKYWQSDEEVDFSKLPEIVKKAFLEFKKAMYDKWNIEDCEVVYREGMGVVFVIEIENEDQEREISLSELGDILKDVLDDDEDEEDDIMPLVIPEEVEQALDELFPDSTHTITILEYEEEDGEHEVDLLDGQRHKEVTFDAEYNWVSTEYEVTVKEALGLLLEEVAANLVDMASKAGVDLMDSAMEERIEIEFEEHVVDGISMEIEIELGDREIEVRIDSEGNITIEQD